MFHVTRTPLLCVTVYGLLTFQAHIWALSNCCLGCCLTESLGLVSISSSFDLNQNLASRFLWGVKELLLSLSFASFMLYLVLWWDTNCDPVFLCCRWIRKAKPVPCHSFKWPPPVASVSWFACQSWSVVEKRYQKHYWTFWQMALF